LSEWSYRNANQRDGNVRSRNYTEIKIILRERASDFVPRLFASFWPPKRMDKKLSLAFKISPTYFQKSNGSTINNFKVEITTTYPPFIRNLITQSSKLNQRCRSRLFPESLNRRRQEKGKPYRFWKKPFGQFIRSRDKHGMTLRGEVCSKLKDRMFTQPIPFLFAPSTAVLPPTFTHHPELPKPVYGHPLHYPQTATYAH